MSLFGKKKNGDGSSTLSESEIRKKLYGEFSERSAHAVAGERDHFKIPVVPSVKDLSEEKETPVDLFSAQKEALSGAGALPRRFPVESKPADNAFRLVPPQTAEKKVSPPSSSPVAADSMARFRYQRPLQGQGAPGAGIVKSFLEKAEGFLSYLMDPEQVVLRRIIYWGTAALVVFLLFWGVNALNSQREDALRARYKIAGKAIATKSSTPAKTAAQPQMTAGKTETVVLPVKFSKSHASEGRVSAPTVATNYVVQVVTYASKQDAEQVLKTFRRAGLRAFIREDTRPSGRVFYPVLLGGFKTEAEAQAYLTKFRTKEVARPFQNAYVRAGRS